MEIVYSAWNVFSLHNGKCSDCRLQLFVEMLFPRLIGFMKLVKAVLAV